MKGVARFHSVVIHLCSPIGGEVDSIDELTYDLDNCSGHAHIYDLEQDDVRPGWFKVDYDISNETNLVELRERCEEMFNKHLMEV